MSSIDVRRKIMDQYFLFVDDVLLFWLHLFLMLLSLQPLQPVLLLLALLLLLSLLLLLLFSLAVFFSFVFCFSLLEHDEELFPSSCEGGQRNSE